MIFLPQKQVEIDGAFHIQSEVTAKANHCVDKEVLKTLWYGCTYHESRLKVETCDSLFFSVGEVEVPETEGMLYAIRVTEKGLCIAADSEKGLLAGFMTLLDQITPELTVKCGEIRENPAFANRMVHYCIFPDTELWELHKFIRFCGALKYSHIVLEFWGMLKLDALKELSWSHAFQKEEIRPLIQEARDMGMEVIPMFNHWGHASASRVMHGKHVVLDQNPRLQYLFNEDGWTWDIRKKEVRELQRKIRRELMEICGEGSYFHLGCDEAYNFEINKENSDAVLDFLREIADDMENAGRRPIMWGDMLVAHHEYFNPKNRYTTNCPNLEMEDYLLSRLDKRIVIADWQYDVAEAPVETAQIFKKAGFDVILCPWDRSEQDVKGCCVTAAEESLLGVMHTTWHTLSAGMPMVTKCAEFSWNKTEQAGGGAGNASRTAALLRKVYFVDGDYRKAGWAKKEIGIIT